MQFTKSSLGTTLLGFSSIGFALPLYLLLLSGFPTVDGFKVCSMIFVQIVSGSIIWAHVMHPRQVDIVEGVGMGLALGSILTVIGHQLLLPTALSKFGWLLPVVVAAIVFATSQSTKGSFKNFVLEDVSGLFFVAFAIVLLLSQWWWLLPLSLPSGLAIYLLSDSGKSKLPNFVRPAWLVIAATFIAATLLMVYLRQLNLEWWIRSWDVTYFESKSYSIAKFGPSENISLLGYPLNYHWFGIAWIGTISSVLGLQSWLSIAQVAPVFSVTAIACLFSAIGKRVGKRISYPIVIALIFTFAIGPLSSANPPNLIGMIWAIAASMVAYDFFSSQKRTFFVIFSVLSIAALSGKVSSGFVVLGAFTITDLYQTFLQKKGYIRCLIRNFLLAAFSIIAFYLIIGGQNRLGNNTFKFSFKGPGYFFGVDPGRDSIIFLLGTVGSSLNFLKVIMILIVCLIYKVGNRYFSILCLGAFTAGYIPFLFVEDDGMTYFISNALNFAGIGAAFLFVSAVTMLRKEVLFSKFQIFSTILTSLILAKFWQTLYETNWREKASFKGGPTPILVLIIILSFISYWLLMLAILQFSKKNHERFAFRIKVITFSVLLIFANSLPNALGHLNRIQEQSRSDTQWPFVGNQNIKAASSWVQQSTGSDSVFATNKFCLEDRVRFCGDARLFLVSATTQRRMLIEGQTRSVQATDETLFPGWAQERLVLSRGFADNPNAEITARLRELGVDWFYLFLDNTENRNWQPFATVEYQNSEVAILKLADPNP
ncbi:MAG: hypothetical protein O2841_02025 [Actinomycetota bacterium]|nr:hypothetical protein [Actinomycetota bacterium]